MKYQWYKCTNCKKDDIKDGTPEENWSCDCVIRIGSSVDPKDNLCILDGRYDAFWVAVTRAEAIKA